MNKTETEAQMHGTDCQLPERRGDWMKDGEGLNQRIFIYASPVDRDNNMDID